MITDEELTKWEALANEAEPGPWEKDGYDVRDGEHCVVADCGYPYDAAFIAESRTAVPQLVEEVRRLRAALEAMENAAYKIQCDWEGTRMGNALDLAEAALRGSK